MAGLNLPNPTDAEGSTIKWKEIGFPALGSVTEIQTELDAENMATVDWITGPRGVRRGPDPLRDRFDVRFGRFEADRRAQGDDR